MTVVMLFLCFALLIIGCYGAQNSYGDEMQTPLTSCELLHCSGGTICSDLGGKPTCVATQVETGNSCSDIICAAGFHCVETVSGPECEKLGKKEQAKEMVCSMNEIVNECGNLCEPTCFNSEPVCLKSCAPPACVCKSGFLRDPNRQLCVTHDECPQISPPQDVFQRMGQPHGQAQQSSGYAKRMMRKLRKLKKIRKVARRVRV